MVAAGIRSILNFAPAVITVPPEVSLRKVDLSIELQILGFHEQRKAVLADVRKGRARQPASVAGT
jgi:redox-sensing transcriptional repressor